MCYSLEHIDFDANLNDLDKEEIPRQNRAAFRSTPSVEQLFSQETMNKVPMFQRVLLAPSSRVTMMEMQPEVPHPTPDLQAPRAQEIHLKR
jgi:hypothetical protein